MPIRGEAILVDRACDQVQFYCLGPITIIRWKDALLCLYLTVYPAFVDDDCGLFTSILLDSPLPGNWVS